MITTHIFHLAVEYSNSPSGGGGFGALLAALAGAVFAGQGSDASVSVK